MKRVFSFLLAVFFAGCNSSRPNGNGGDFSYTVNGNSVLIGADVLIENSSGKMVAEGTTDSQGNFTVEGVAEATGIVVKVCGGSFISSSLAQPVAYSGCLKSKIDGTDSDVNINVIKTA